MSGALAEPLVAVLLRLEGHELRVAGLELLLNLQLHGLDLRVLSCLGLQELQRHDHGIRGGGSLLEAAVGVLDEGLHSFHEAGEVGAEELS